MHPSSICAKGLLALTLAASANAARVEPSVSTAALFPSVDSGSVTPHVATGLSTGFESPFTPGTINGQQGWTVSTVSSVPVTTANIVNTTPISGAQSLRLTDTTSVTSGNTTGAFSPVSAQAAPDSSITSFTTKITGVTPGPSGGADYFVSGQSPAQAFLSWKVDFYYQGQIRVLDYPGVGQTGTLGYQNIGTWTAGTAYDISVKFLPAPGATPGATTAAGSIVYSINGVPVYTADSLVAGTTNDQFVLLSDNFQVSGESGTFDNLSVSAVPEPTSLAALACAGLLGLRRRR